MDWAEQCEEKLTALLEGEEKILLLRLLNAENEISSTIALENFILGFRLGARLILEGGWISSWERDIHPEAAWSASGKTASGRGGMSSATMRTVCPGRKMCWQRPKRSVQQN